MDLNTIWFVLIAILYTGYFILEGFDFGVGILQPFITKNDNQRRMVINTIGPHWDGNEVWLITAGGATFAAFPNWYATLFSGFYLPLFLMLVALVLRGVALEFRSKDNNPRWRAFWDWSLFAGSLIPALLWGVAFANFLRGVPIDASQNYIGGFWNLLNPYALLAGLLTVTGFTLQGCLFLSIKIEGEVLQRVQKLAARLWIPNLIMLIGLWAYSFVETDLAASESLIAGILPYIAVLTVLITGLFVYRKRFGWAFAFNSVTILLVTCAAFIGLFPRVLISSLNPEWSLTVYNASSSPYTLQVMSIIALVFVPIVLVYQGWTYWIFRKRISDDPKKLVY